MQATLASSLAVKGVLTSSRHLSRHKCQWVHFSAPEYYCWTGIPSELPSDSLTLCSPSAVKQDGLVHRGKIFIFATTTLIPQTPEYCWLPKYALSCGYALKPLTMLIVVGIEVCNWGPEPSLIFCQDSLIFWHGQLATPENSLDLFDA